jgi:predicted enzyme related to lactoylglutathione lyase
MMTSPERRSAMAHPVVWFEVLGHIGERLRQFYGGVFGWRFDVENPMKYGMVDTGDQRPPDEVRARRGQAVGRLGNPAESQIAPPDARIECLGGRGSDRRPRLV